MNEEYNMREFNLLEASSDLTTIDSDGEEFLESKRNQSLSFCLPFFLPERIKSRARRVAWYSPSANPFGKRSGTWTTPATAPDPNIDLENQPVQNFGRTSSEPPLQTRDFRGSGEAASPRTSTRQSDARGTGRDIGNSSEETAVECQSVGEQPIRKRKNDGNSEKTKTSTGFTLKSIKSNKSLKHKQYTIQNQLRSTIFNSWINILLLAAPAGIALNYAPGVSPWAVFFVNFAAIIPLAALLSYGTEEIALRVGETLGGLLNATFGNAVELIVSIIALVKKEFLIVKTSLIGSILSNLLLVMGMSFFFGGIRREEQFFNKTVASTAASLLALAIASVIIPTAFEEFALGDTDNEAENLKKARTAAISRGSSIILLFIYGCYLYFQLGTHSAMYQIESQKAAKRPSSKNKAPGSALKGVAAAGGLLTAHGRSRPVDQEGITQEDAHDEIMQRDAWELQAEQDKEADDEPQLHIWVAIATLVLSTAVVALCAESMVGSIDKITGTSGISAEFVGLILLPIVGNAAEHATAVTVACKDKMDLAIGVSVGSSMQISLLVIPFTVIVGWIMGADEMNLSFDGFQVAVLFVSVLLVNYLISDGKSNWLEGMLLQCLYLIIAVTAWFYPPVPATE